LVAAAALLDQAIVRLLAGHSVQAAIFAAFAGAAGILLLAGLWTPVVGSLAALVELRNILSHTDNLRICVLLGALGVALAMIGPGAWSIDARLFGWKRINPHDL
jgi:uncharacterized membrane protein YphA (DoxX/SURF4 family)